MGRSISPEHYFFLCNGSVAGNVRELALLIGDLAADEFNHHVNDEKNDFANWMADVLGRQKLAKELGGSKCQKDHQILIFRNMVKG